MSEATTLLRALRGGPAARVAPGGLAGELRADDEEVVGDHDRDRDGGDDDHDGGESAVPEGEAGDALEAELDALEQGALAAIAAAGDDGQLADFDADAEPPRVQLAPEGGEPIPVARFHAEIVEACVEMIASLGRDRALLPARERATAEARILAQVDAILAAPRGCIDTLFAFFRGAVAPSDRWRVWASLFVLGCIDGDDALQAIAAALESLPPDARVLGLAAAEALAVAPHPELGRLAATLASSAHPVARAVALDARSRLGVVAPEAVLSALRDASTVVVEAAIRAAERLPEPPAALAALLLPRLVMPSPAVSFHAARLLARLGRPEPYEIVKAGDRPVALQGADALEVFVWCGVAGDLPRMESILARAPVTPAILSALGRFGHPGAWAFLSHHLADDELEGAAASALEVVFGPRVPPAERRSPRAWRSAIAAARLDLGVRYRGGEPWRPETVLAECASGELARGETACRVDELAARGRQSVAVDLCRWTPDPEAQLEAFAARIRHAMRDYAPGKWR